MRTVIGRPHLDTDVVHDNTGEDLRSLLAKCRVNAKGGGAKVTFHNEGKSWAVSRNRRGGACQLRS